MIFFPALINTIPFKNRLFCCMKSYCLKQAEAESSRQWVHIDAEGKPLGRLATQVAILLRGKDHADYTPHVDSGAFVVVTNASKVKLTERSFRTSGIFGTQVFLVELKIRPLGELMAESPGSSYREKAVYGMLARARVRGPLTYQMISKLKVYAGETHPHAAQKPEKLS